MTTAQVVEMSVTVNNNSPIQDYVHPDDQTQPTFEMTPGFKPFTVLFILLWLRFDKLSEIKPALKVKICLWKIAIDLGFGETTHLPLP